MNSIQPNRLKLMSIALFACMTSWTNSYANSDSNLAAAGISPTRIVIPANQKSASVTITNSSSTEVAYRMNLIEMGLNENGSFNILQPHQIPASQRSAKPYVRFSPRQVRLKPGQSQVVRAIVRRGSLPVQGEYRSHLRLQALPVLSTADLEDATQGDPVLVQSSARIELGVTIPVIIRHGKTESSVTLDEVRLNFNNDGTANIARLLLGLKGTRSSFGDISVSLVNGRDEKHLSRLRAFALYYPYPHEWIDLELDNPLNRNEIGPNSKIRVRFENRAIDSSKAFWLDDAVAPVLD